MSLPVLKPFSDNVIFVDTEFSTLDPYEGEILSVGIVKLTGEELYLELEYDGETSEWVRANILPTLKGPKIRREEARRRISEFIGDGKPYMVGYVNQFDTIYWYKLFSIDNHPCYWMPIDIASILFALGIDPEKYVADNLKSFCEEIGVDHKKFKTHYALDDAKLAREIYLHFLGTGKGG